MLAVAFNYAAVNAKRQYGITTERQKKNVEKLSSGFRINRAADNAAGLSISEKMRKQMRGLSRGTTNAQDGISLLQIADGSLAEMTAMMHRMTELSIQSANGTYSDDDRKAMQDEIKQLQMEINGEVDRTKFNDMPIFPEAIEDTEAEDAGVLPEVSIDGTRIIGTARDDSVNTYAFSADENGVTINGETTPYSNIVADDGVTTMDSLKAGTYRVKANGLTFPVTISDAKTTGGLAKALGRFSVTRTKVPDRALRQAVSSASITAASGVAAGKSVTVKADENGINGISWANIPGLEALDRNLPVGSDRTVNVSLGNGFTLTMDVDKEAGREGIAKAVNGMSAKVVVDTSSSYSNLTCYPNRLANGSEAPVNLKANHDSSNFEWSLLSDPANDDALKKVADKLKCQPTDLVNGNLKVSFAYDKTSNPPKLPTAKFTAENAKAKGRSASVNYEMSEDDAEAMAEALAPDKEYKDGDPVFDATFTYEGSTFTAHLTAYKDITPTRTPRANAIMDPSKEDATGAATISFKLQAGTKLLTSGSVKSIEEGNVINYKYKDSYKVSENGVTEEGSEPPIPKRTWWIQSGADTLSGLTVSVGKISLHLLGLDDMDISTEDGATKGIDKAAKALDYVSKVRSEIGAQQNRLEHTIANNDNAVENTTASESRIRDADMADEMVEFHRNNILELVGESVIAQANSQQQDVLNLLNQ